MRTSHLRGNTRTDQSEHIRVHRWLAEKIRENSWDGTTSPPPGWGITGLDRRQDWKANEYDGEIGVLA